ncbi:MAG: anti-sigma factor [Bacteroidota bacterium]
MDINAYIGSGIIESYVLGLASAEEVVEVEALAMQYPAIKAAVDDFALLLEAQVLQNAVRPPAEIKQQLLDTLADEFAEPKVIIMAPPVTGGAGVNDKKVVALASYGKWRFVAAAAIILLVVSAALNVYYYNNYKTASDNYTALLESQRTLQANNQSFQTKLGDLQSTINIFQDSAMHVVKMAPAPGKDGNLATVYWDTRTKDVYVYANNLQQTPAGKQYQLWAIVDGKPVDAGMLTNCDGVCKMKNIPNAQAFAITLEKEGGSPQPDLKSLYVIGKT